MHTRGNVPHFTLRPHPLVSGLFIFILVIGLLATMALLAKEEGTGVYRQKANLTMAVTGITCACLAILATSKLWFPHLWKKNSAHARHKKHTRHHPEIKKKEFRRR